jgi:ATP-dependent DNA helicase RecG
MTESQNIEYKSVWRDEYPKWICGFANANGGKLFIGIDDNGQIAGIPDANRLMEDIPNKVVQHLGLTIEANLLYEENKKYIEIVVPPSSLPVSYHGVFHYRSGSTKQELKGTALHNFLLRKMGKSWDAIITEGAAIADLDTLAVRLFSSLDILKFGAGESQRYLTPVNLPVYPNRSWRSMPVVFR